MEDSVAGYQKELDLARTLAREAGLAALRRRGSGIVFESKSDESPVTAADRESERIITAGIDAAFPADGVLGEEGAAKESRSGRLWIIDPIDGTRDFIRNNLTWAVLIGLEDSASGEVIAGVAHFPALDRTYVATLGGGAFLNDAPIRISPIDSIAQAVVNIGGFNNMARHGFAARIPEWIAPFWAFRSMGGCLDAMMVASGQAEIWIEPGGKAWDFAPLKLIATEAGARFLNFNGASSIYGGNAIIAVPPLAAEALRFVGGSGR
ncbi:MAG: inositol monophosphatase [Candidatus Solibacter usitatus]|nr:inositol monophosphatase [Candidatus Solibacter usitatus]